MIKKMALAFFFIALMLGSTAALAEIKVAVVNVPKLMKEAPQAEKISKDLRDQFADREKALLAEQEDIKKLEGQYSKDKDIVSAKEREAMEKDLREKLRNFQRKSNAFTEDVGAAKNESLAELQTEIYNAIMSIAESGKYDLILGEAVLYASDKIDVTDQVLDKLKQAK